MRRGLIILSRFLAGNGRFKMYWVGVVVGKGAFPLCTRFSEWWPLEAMTISSWTSHRTILCVSSVRMSPETHSRSAAVGRCSVTVVSNGVTIFALNAGSEYRLFLTREVILTCHLVPRLSLNFSMCVCVLKRSGTRLRKFRVSYNFSRAKKPSFRTRQRKIWEWPGAQ